MDNDVEYMDEQLEGNTEFRRQMTRVCGLLRQSSPFPDPIAGAGDNAPWLLAVGTKHVVSLDYRVKESPQHAGKWCTDVDDWGCMDLMFFLVMSTTYSTLLAPFGGVSGCSGA